MAGVAAIMLGALALLQSYISLATHPLHDSRRMHASLSGHKPPIPHQHHTHNSSIIPPPAPVHHHRHHAPPALLLPPRPTWGSAAC